MAKKKTIKKLRYFVEIQPHFGALNRDKMLSVVRHGPLLDYHPLVLD